ncbi:MAG: hypothetical protein WC783_00975 [Candidatus Paceibacterota bacterium]|jgi:hypothetical protein
MIRKYAEAITVYPSINERQWQRFKSNDPYTFKKYAANISLLHSYADIIRPAGLIIPDKKKVTKFDPNQYIYSHVSIVASVDVGADGHTIKPETAEYVNDNGDAWERELLKLSYPTFIGGFNFYEHNQDPNLRKGWVIDAVARDTDLSLIVDILIATDRQHKDLCERIITGDLSTVSMGCVCKYCICSKCGKVLVDETDYCDHIKRNKGASYETDKGTSIIAELCGSKQDPTSVIFEEGSWVEVPAWKKAKAHNVITADLKNNKAVEVLKFAHCTNNYCTNFDYNKVPEEYRNELLAKLKPENKKVASCNKCSMSDYYLSVVEDVYKNGK